MVRPRHGPEGGQGQEFTDFVRHSLHAAADQVEPGADGLERIHEKIRTRPAYATARESRKAAIAAFLADLVRRWHAVRAGLTAWLDRKREGSGPSRARHTRPGEPQRPRDWREALLRPALAVGISVFAVGVVLATVPPLRHQILQTLGVSSQSSAPPSGSGPGQQFGASESARGVASDSDTAATFPACSSSPAAASSSKPGTQTTTPAAHSTSPTAPASNGAASASGSASGSGSPNGSTSASASGSGSTTPPPTHTPTPAPSPSHSATTTHQTAPTPTGSCTSSATRGGSPTVSSKPKTSPGGSSSPGSPPPATRSRPASATPSDTSGGNGGNLDQPAVSTLAGSPAPGT